MITTQHVKFVLPVLLTRQKMNIILYKIQILTALHINIAQSGTDIPYIVLRVCSTAIFSGPAPCPGFFLYITVIHDPRVIAKFLHKCFAHRSRLLEGILGVPQHKWQSFIF